MFAKNEKRFCCYLEFLYLCAFLIETMKSKLVILAITALQAFSFTVHSQTFGQYGGVSMNGCEDVPESLQYDNYLGQSDNYAATDNSAGLMWSSTSEWANGNTRYSRPSVSRYRSYIYEPFSGSPSQPTGPRKGVVKPGDPGNQDIHSPIGEPLVLLLFSLFSALKIAFSHRRRE